jgi:hypothetical protein
MSDLNLMDKIKNYVQLYAYLTVKQIKLNSGVQV